MRPPIFILLIMIFLLFALPIAAQAQTGPSIQEINDSLAPGQSDLFRLDGLKRGQVLYAFMENTSGNLDPILSILSADGNFSAIYDEYKNAVAELVATSDNPMLDLPALRDEYTLAWDDDSGPGYAAALQFRVPEDGDYFLLAGSSLSAAGRQTAGNYRLLIGLGAPEILMGTALPAGEIIAVPEPTAMASYLIQEYSGSLNQNKPSVSIRLNDLNPGDTLYVNLEAVSGDLKPILLLRDFGNKPVQVANLNGMANGASFEMPLPEGGANYFLDIQPASVDGQLTSGDYRLLVGINAPEVLEGQGQPNSDALLKLPIPVKVGIKLQQIVNIDQPNEIMNDVGTLKLEWTDPALAFNPDECNCNYHLYTETSFNDFLEDVKGQWPDFTFFNQQGNRWAINRLIKVDSSGHVVYLERFSTNFQVDFDWTAFPFDTQDFYIKLDLLLPEEYYEFVPMDGFNEIDPLHGEDEFILTDFDTQISTEISSLLQPTSRFTFHFSAPRHLDYYIFRIFVPILLIISVSYITFFLKDYMRRIEVATGNLLLFIAFSFSMGDNYPRMGYLTFVDAVMAVTFFINTLVVILNVYFKYLENKGEREKADRLDKPFNYLYPLAYLVSFGVLSLMFL